MAFGPGLIYTELRCVGDGRPMQRGASLTTSEHVDLGAMPAAENLEDDDDPADVRLHIYNLRPPPFISFCFPLLLSTTGQIPPKCSGVIVLTEMQTQ